MEPITTIRIGFIRVAAPNIGPIVVVIRSIIIRHQYEYGGGGSAAGCQKCCGHASEGRGGGVGSGEWYASQW